MFSQRPQVAIAAFLVLSFAVHTAIGQQPQSPSQRFNPERSVPPSVHIPSADAQPINTARITGPSFNFSDTPATAFRSSNPNQLRGTNGAPNTRQVSYDEEVNTQQTEVPSELRSFNNRSQANNNGGRSNPVAQPIQNLRPPERNSINEVGRRIVVSEDEFKSHNQNLAERPIPPASLQQQTIQTTAFNAPQDQIQRVSNAGLQSASNEISTLPSSVQSADFNAPVAPQSQIRPIKKVSAESEMVPGASLSMQIPAIRVQAFGPESIGINKIATYKITVSNDGNQDAEDIQVGVGIPANIELQNINVSTGHHETSNTDEQSQLIWKIDRVSAKTTHTIAVNVIPRSPERFDMQVEWMFVPRTAMTSVEVTQPQLEMKIAGPTEVLFGEKATYDVTVYNPGTGTAEKVSVMLPEELGGERAEIGDVPAGGEKQFKVELFARTAGELSLAATAVGADEIDASASHQIRVRRAKLAVDIEGPKMKYAGSVGQYTVTVSNEGDATASGVAAVLAMPNGVKYTGGVNNVENNQSGIKWNIGTMTSGDRRTFKVNCQLDASGSLMFQAGARGTGDLAATGQCQTQVDTVADLILSVMDPKGPLPTAENTEYKIVVKNRGTRSANGVNIVMQFSEGIEPIKAAGFKNKIATGQVIFSPIGRIDPGQEVLLNVTAQAQKAGTHVFRAQLTCEESDSREIAEGTTKFFGEEAVADQGLTLPANNADSTAGTGLNGFK